MLQQSIAQLKLRVERTNSVSASEKTTKSVYLLSGNVDNQLPRSRQRILIPPYYTNSLGDLTLVMP